MNAKSLNFFFPQEHLPAAMLVSLSSVWVLVGLFFYLNRFTKRYYFTVWNAAWLFYALWLTLNFNVPGAEPGDVVFMCKQCCVAMSAVFLLWGSLLFLDIPVPQRMFGLFMAFLLVWTFVSPERISNPALIQLPVFLLLGLGSGFAGWCFFRLRKKTPFVGAGMLSLGFLLWAVYMAIYPFLTQNINLASTGFFVAAVLQLFIAISMIVLVLEEVRYNAEKISEEIAAVRSEKEALQVKVLTTEKECHNLYDKVRLQQGVQKAYDELRRTQQTIVQQERLRALGQMASGIAHDVNNALSPVVAYSELLLTQHPDLPETARNHLRIINRSGDDIAHIVARMREFYRRRSGTEPLVQVSMNIIIKEVAELTRPRWRDVAQRNGIAIDMQRELGDDLPIFWGDPSDLREALTNLIFNSVDALPQGGAITLVTKFIPDPDGDGQIQVEVRDNGIGMDENIRQRCLEPFFTTKGQRGGTGLGLAMVYGMMQRHDGVIEIESNPGRGTCIRLTFPVRKKNPGGTRGTATQSKTERTLNILCIDDEAHIRQLLNDCLGHFNHRVTLAANGREGLELFRAANKAKRPYEVVITDLGMPDVDGNQVARQIKAESPLTPIVMFTGWGTAIRDNNETAPAVDALVNKPPHIHQLNDLLLRLTDPDRQKP